MYSPYSPDLDAPDMANPFEAETFRVLGFGLRLGFKGGLGAIRTNLKGSIKLLLKKTFSVPRSIRKLMKGADDTVIEFAIKNPDRAADSLAEQVSKHILATKGNGFHTGKKKFIDDLPPNWKLGDSTKIKGIQYTDDVISPFYQSGGKKRVIKYKVADPNAGKQTPKELEGIGSDGNVLADASTTPGATNDMESALRQLETSVDGNPIKSTMDDLLADGGKLSDEGIEIATKEIAAGGKGAYGDDFIKSLDDISPNSLRNQSADDVAKRALGSYQKTAIIGVIGIAAVVMGGWIANNFLSDYSSRFFMDYCTREYYEDKFPNDTSAEIDLKLETCLDEAAKRIMYLGAAGIGVFTLIILFIISRVLKKPKKVTDY